MAQISWVYVTPTHRQYGVGLYHGDDSRHVLVFVNNQVLKIDFHVVEDKTYSFFIEDELCEIQMKRKSTHWSYDFKVNHKVDTLVNQERRKAERRYLFYSIGFLLLLVLVVSAFIYFFL